VKYPVRSDISPLKTHETRRLTRLVNVRFANPLDGGEERQMTEHCRIRRGSTRFPPAGVEVKPSNVGERVEEILQRGYVSIPELPRKLADPFGPNSRMSLEWMRYSTKVGDCRFGR
jgi:hypothetical protein